MKPRFVKIPEKKFVGFSIKMSLMNNKTAVLWRKFMPRKKEIKNTISSDLFSMQVYPEHFDFTTFSPQTEFAKLAATEVSNFDVVPEEFETFTLPGGLYAVFDYKGSSSDPKIFHHIFGEWLPNSGYFLDNRPHFEVLGENYINNDPESEEEIWIPIKRK